MPDNVHSIAATFLTDTHDLYIAVETINDYYEFYHLDLDDDNPMINGPILKYSFKKVGGDSELKGF